jgi:hypothetical protein
VLVQTLLLLPPRKPPTIVSARLLH